MVNRNRPKYFVLTGLATLEVELMEDIVRLDIMQVLVRF